MRQAIDMIIRHLSIDLIIYLAILLVVLAALIRCVFPLALRRGM